MTLAHDHLTDLLISSYRGLLLLNLNSKSNSVIEVDWTLLHWGVVTSLPYDHETLINLYISSYREAIGATFIHGNAQVIIDFLLQIFCDNKIQQNLQERQMFSWQLTCLQALVFVLEQSNEAISPLTFFFQNSF